jgi:hypothetical protein
MLFDFWRFGLDVHEVMTTRMLRMMTGELSAGEARLMITEKQTAYSRAQMSGAHALLTGGPLEAGREMADVYRRAVRANCSRLAKAPGRSR